MLEFNKDFDENGPLIPNIPARVASDRVLLFQNRFDDLWHKYEVYTNGQRLFGLEESDYPVLHKRKKEFAYLNKLYHLYNKVMNSIDRYYDMLWAAIDIESINNEILEFINACRKLPKGLKEWPAYQELKKRIDDFNETCPLLEVMTTKALKERHWLKLTLLTGHTFNFDSESFSLGNVMQAPLLRHKDDIEVSKLKQTKFSFSPE